MLADYPLDAHHLDAVVSMVVAGLQEVDDGRFRQGLLVLLSLSGATWSPEYGIREASY